MSYIVVNVGCIHCGRPSSLVGHYDTKEVAEEVTNKVNNNQASDRRAVWFEIPSSIARPTYNELDYSLLKGPWTS